MCDSGQLIPKHASWMERGSILAPSCSSNKGKRPAGCVWGARKVVLQVRLHDLCFLPEFCAQRGSLELARFGLQLLEFEGSDDLRL